MLVVVLRRVSWMFLFVARSWWFRLSKLLVRFGVGLLRVRFWSFCLCGGFVSIVPVVAPHFGRPSPNLAEKCEVRLVSLPRLNSAPCIPGGASGRPAGAPVHLDLGVETVTPIVIRASLKGAS